MVAFNKFYSTTEDIAEKQNNLGSDTLKVMLSNTTPIATNSAYSDLSGAEVANGGGYTTGGASVSISSSTQTTGTYKLVIGNASWTGSGSGFGPYRYATLYDSTSGRLLGWWDYGSSVSTLSGETFAVQFDASAGVLQIA